MRHYRWGHTLGALALAAVLAGPAAAQRVVVNQREVHFRDQPPVQRGGRVYIPLRGVLERIGAERIDWRPERGEVFVASGGREIELRIDSNRARVDGQPVELDAPAILMGGRTMVPLRFVGENLGATVDWDGASETVFITAPTERVAGRREVYPPEPREQSQPARRAEPTAVAPLIRGLRPQPGAMVSARRPEITATLRARGGSIDYDSIHMRVNGVDVTPDLEVGDNTVTYRPREPLDPGRTNIRLVVRDSEGNTTTRDWSFEVR